MDRQSILEDAVFLAEAQLKGAEGLRKEIEVDRCARRILAFRCALGADGATSPGGFPRGASLSEEEKSIIDKRLYQYKIWERLLRVCTEEVEWIEARYGARSPADFSELAELGMTPAHSGISSPPQERIVEKKEAVLRDQQDYATLLRLRMGRIEKGMEGLSEVEKRVLSERYFSRRSMVGVIAAIEGLSEAAYTRAIRRIREEMAPFVLGVFAAGA